MASYECRPRIKNISDKPRGQPDYVCMENHDFRDTNHYSG